MEKFNIKLILSKSEGQCKNLLDANRDCENISAFNVCKFAQTSIITCLKSALVVEPDYYQARNAYERLKEVEDNVYLLPPKDDVLSYVTSFSGDNAINRMVTLGKIATNQARIVVTSPEALIQSYPLRQDFNGYVLKKDNSYDLEHIIKRLVALGYKREQQISDIGQFALRGDILDIWTINEPTGVRIEFFGDYLESMKYLNMEEQTSTTKLDELVVCPFTEIFPPKDITGLIDKIKNDIPASLEPDYNARIQSIVGDIVSRLQSGDRNLSLSFILPYLPHTYLKDFCSFDTVVFTNPKGILDNLNIFYKEHNNRYKVLLSRGECLKSSINQLYDIKSSLDFDCKKLAFHSVMTQNNIFTPTRVFDFKTMDTITYTKDMTMLCQDVQNYVNMGYKVYIATGREGVHENIKSLFRRNNIGYGNDYFSNVCLIDSFLSNGAIFHDDKIVVMGTNDISYKSQKRSIKRSKSDVFNEPKAGDYVVHEVHGIGMCAGVTKMEIDGIRRDYVVIKYAGNDVLYVPIENMDSLSKYVSSETPTLSKMGGAEFAKQKAKVYKSVKKLAIDLLQIYAERQAGKGHKYSSDDTLLDEFSKSFNFAETEDQLTAINEGLNDLKSGKIMDRLLCGDVGYGKTEVALRIAFKVIEEGKQVAFISPTTILAKQHFNTVMDRMSDFGIKAVRITRLDSPANIKKSLQAIKNGEVDIAVGTHRLLSKDVEFNDLGLLILDEEQRFGVGDKEKIKDIKRNVNVLTLSATPIPRTLHMSMIGVRDISILDTPPFDRLPVQTYVLEYSDSVIIDAVNRELGRKGQVFMVYNKVEKMDSFALKMQRLMPNVKITTANGQMQEKVLEERIDDFASGNSDVLIASTIIENGIDMPRANTIIVIDSDRLGLSQLYQLKGRVGRSNKLAYAFFTFDGDKTLSETAYKRLEAITMFTEFGSGFKIAMRDLEIRGAGTIMGAEQHGHIEKVGYDMYCKILSDAMAEIGGTERITRREVKITSDYNTYIPDGYVGDREWRLRLYSRISKLSSLKEMNKLKQDMLDIYGKVPSQVHNLMMVALSKNLASFIGATNVVMTRQESQIVFENLSDITKEVMDIGQKFAALLQVSAKPGLKFKNNEVLLKFLLKFQK